MGMTDNAKFEPDWASPPGDTIKELLHGRQMSTDDLAARTGLPAGFLGLLLTGDAELTPDIAVQMERVFGGSTAFWERREADFRAALRRQIGVIAAEVTARGLDMGTVAERSGLPQPYVTKVLAQSTYFAPWVVEQLRRSVSKPEPTFKEDEARRVAFGGAIQGKVLYRDNWTEQDHENERAYRREISDVVARRRTTLLERGWKVFSQRSTERGGCAVRSWAIDPLSGKRMLESEANELQEQREPSSVEPWPKRSHALPVVRLRLTVGLRQRLYGSTGAPVG